VQYPSLIADTLSPTSVPNPRLSEEGNVVQVDHDGATLRYQRLHDVLYFTCSLIDQPAMTPNRRHFNPAFNGILNVAMKKEPLMYLPQDLP
jgi:hypothetical protein